MPLVPPRSYRIPLSSIVRPLLRSVVGKHGSPPMFRERRIYGLLHPGHPDISNIGMALCCHLIVLSEVVLVLTPPISLASLVMLEPVPPEGLTTCVVV